MQSPRYRTFEIQLCSMGNPIYKAIQNIFSNFQSQHKYFCYWSALWSQVSTLNKKQVKNNGVDMPSCSQKGDN